MTDAEGGSCGAKARSDYLGVHEPRYARIAASQEAGWSSDEEVEGMLSQLDWALGQAGELASEGGQECTPHSPRRPPAYAVLELGCGDGCLTAQLAARQGWRISGVDIVPLAIELSRKRLAAAGLTANLACANVTSIPWPDAVFDLVVDGHCLHCIVGGDRGACLREVRRVLRPGGLFVVITMCGEPADRQGGVFDPVSRNLVRAGIAGRHFGTVDGILGELSAAGFSTARHRIWPARHARENDDLVVAAKPLPGLDAELP